MSKYHLFGQIKQNNFYLISVTEIERTRTLYFVSKLDGFYIKNDGTIIKIYSIETIGMNDNYNLLRKILISQDAGEILSPSTISINYLIINVDIQADSMFDSHI